jgi:hypothetical protein
MAELHDALVARFRKKLISKGYKEGRCPIQTYRPDIFCIKINSSGETKEEVIVEAEIQPTLYSEHTSIQLILMDEYIKSPKNRKRRIAGYLLVPHKKSMLNYSISLLASIFPEKCVIKVLQLKI